MHRKNWKGIEKIYVLKKIGKRFSFLDGHFSFHLEIIQVSVNLHVLRTDIHQQHSEGKLVYSMEIVEYMHFLHLIEEFSSAHFYAISIQERVFGPEN